MHSSPQKNKKFLQSTNLLQSEYNNNNILNNINYENNNNFNNSFTRNSVQSESESSYKSDPIYRHLNLIFFGLFSEHNFSPEDKFDKNVWFLKNNSEFQKLISNMEYSNNNSYINKTPEGPILSSSHFSRELIRILQECSFGGKNLKTLLVEVKKFVNEISKILFAAQQRKANAEEMVKHYKMDETKELILDKLLKEKANLNFLNDITEVQFSISKLDGFPEGAYDFRLFCEAFADSESPLIQTQEIRKKLISQNFQQKIILATHNINQRFSKPELFELLEIRNEKNFEYLNLEEVCLSRSKFSEEASYIGLLLNSFKFVAFKEEVFFASSEAEMLVDNFINNLDLLLKDKAFKCSSAAFAYVDGSNRNYVKAGLDNCKLVLYYDLEVNFNKKTKLLVLEKIYNVFYETITTKFDNEKLINEVLSCFYEISKDVKGLFSEKKNVNAENCGPCNNCTVF